MEKFGWCFVFKWEYAKMDEIVFWGVNFEEAYDKFKKSIYGQKGFLIETYFLGDANEIR